MNQPDIPSADRHLVESERKYRELVEQANSIILRWNRAGILTFMNEFGLRFFGYTAEELVGRHVVGTIVPESDSLGRDLGPLMDQICADPKAFEHNTNENMRRGGERVWIDWTNRVEWNEHGEIETILSVGTDITGRRQAEERLKQLADNIREVFWLTDSEYQAMLYVSPACEAVWGRSCAELYANPHTWTEAVHPDDRDAVIVVLERARESPQSHEHRILLPGGAVRWVHLRASAIHDAKGRVYRIAGVAEDVTDRRKMEEQLRQSQKMDAFGQLAAGVAHDFNNLLTVISGYSEVLMSGTSSDDPKHEFISEIKAAGERAAALTRQLLAFSRQTVLNPRVLELDRVVANVEKMLKRLIGADVILRSRLDAAPAHIRVDPGHLEQVLMNLAVNARDAMPTGGELTIATKRVEVGGGWPGWPADLPGGAYVVLSMRDTGGGMTDEVRGRVFEPFFTTKAVGKGTGLGLAVVHGIVKQAAGHIEIDSSVGGGTTFRIYFPAVGPAADAAQGAVSRTLRGGGETILFVEDEERVRRLGVVALRAEGYRVFEASSGTQALELIREHGEQIDLLASDVVMPGMSGGDLRLALEKRHPRIPVLFISGYTDDAIVRHGIVQDEVAFLPKPYTPSSLALKVREVLDTREGVPGA